MHIYGASVIERIKYGVAAMSLEICDFDFYLLVDRVHCHMVCHTRRNCVYGRRCLGVLGIRRTCLLRVLSNGGALKV